MNLIVKNKEQIFWDSTKEKALKKILLYVVVIHQFSLHLQ